MRPPLQPATKKKTPFRLYPSASRSSGRSPISRTTSRVSPKDTVAIQPRVSGYLNKVSFKEGAEVKEGDVLYEIDPRLHQAQVEAARAKLALAEATLKLARMTN